MPHAAHTLTINRPAADVFAFIAEGVNAHQWRAGVIEIAKISGEGVGTTYQQSVRGPGGRPVAADYRITEFQPNSSLAFEATAGPVRPRGRFELEEQDGPTRVTFSLEAELDGLKKLVMGRMVAKTMESEVRSLDKLKAVLEA